MLLQIRVIWNTFSLNSSSQNCTIFVTLHMDKKYLSATTGMVSRCVTFTQQYFHCPAFHLIYCGSSILCLFLSVDPHQREKYLNSSIYLAPLNGEINHDNLTGSLRLQCEQLSLLFVHFQFSGLESCCVVCFCSLSAWRDSFLRIEKLVLIGGPDDGVITPWESRSLHQCYCEWAFIFMLIY